MRVTFPHPTGRPDADGPRHRATDPASAWSAQQWAHADQAQAAALAAEQRRRQYEEWRRWDEQQRARRAEAERAVWLRGTAAMRLRLVNLRHAEYAWRLRASHGIAATAVALLYADPFPQLDIKVAGKMFPDADEVADPATMLADLGEEVRTILAEGQDPRTALSEHPDLMSPQAVFYGAAVSLLDTPGGPWRETQGKVTRPGAIPGRVLALLVDGTGLLADRFEHHQPVNYRVAATQPADPGWATVGRTWQQAPELLHTDDAVLAAVWYHLHQLATILAGPGRG
jgi:hypothetical protein